MRCPMCNRETTRKGNPFRPFCSERCQLLDLHNWLSERHRVLVPADTSRQSDEAPNRRQADKGERG